VPAQQPARHWRQNTELIALRVTDNASQHGEHYITETRAEYWSDGALGDDRRFRHRLHGLPEDPPRQGAHAAADRRHRLLPQLRPRLLPDPHPARHRRHQAAGDDRQRHRRRHQRGRRQAAQRRGDDRPDRAAPAAARSSPFSATSASPSRSRRCSPGPFSRSAATHFTSARNRCICSKEQSLLHSGALFYAAIAGVCLFISGLISGYYDNYAAYNRVPERILQLAGRSACSANRACAAFATYIGDNLGALAGNLLFGFLLGGTTLFGLLVGLPIDIRHVAFSSAFVGIAFVGLDYSPNTCGSSSGR
jgi:hypothetical protein